MPAMAPTDTRCTIRTNLNTNSVHITSLAECSGRYGVNKKTIIIFGTVLIIRLPSNLMGEIFGLFKFV